MSVYMLQTKPSYLYFYFRDTGSIPVSQCRHCSFVATYLAFKSTDECWPQIQKLWSIVTPIRPIQRIKFTKSDVPSTGVSAKIDSNILIDKSQYTRYTTFKGNSSCLKNIWKGVDHVFRWLANPASRQVVPDLWSGLPIGFGGLGTKTSVLPKSIFYHALRSPHNAFQNISSSQHITDPILEVPGPRFTVKTVIVW